MNPYEPSNDPDPDRPPAKLNSYEWILFGGLACIVGGVLLGTVGSAVQIGMVVFGLGLAAVVLSLR